MSQKEVRVRFAPSPTGGLHLGGMRTALFNYLFAKHHNGTFIVRTEDTDQTRFVAGAEDYIFQCLAWCNIHADESVLNPGAYGPYRQTERKPMYKQYADQLVKDGFAYIAFDTPAELEAMRNDLKTTENPAPQYDKKTRAQMRNSLSLSEGEVQTLIAAGTPYVIRLKVPENETVSFTDMIRGHISYDTNVVDDKVLLKADEMPTYHLAVVVDDYLMKISHAFRGEEWLPSAPIHILLWQYLGWEKEMPEWAHLPLILKPDGNGKLSKRDGERLGFPVFAMDWKDPNTDTIAIGFKEMGFLPEAFVNLLAVLGWNDGSEKELFSMEELIAAFTMDRVHKGGAKFDFEKAKWFNQQYILHTDNEKLAQLTAPYFTAENIQIDTATLPAVIGMVKERCHLLSDFITQARFFYQDPAVVDTASIAPKWTPEKTAFFEKWAEDLNAIPWNMEALETAFTAAATAAGIKKGELMLPLRIMLVGGKFGPGVFDIVAFIGIKATQQRIQYALSQLK